MDTDGYDNNGFSSNLEMAEKVRFYIILPNYKYIACKLSVGSTIRTFVKLAQLFLHQFLKSRQLL